MTPFWFAVLAAACWGIATYAYRSLHVPAPARLPDPRLLALCLALYLISSFIVYGLLGYIGILFGALYAWVIFRTWRVKTVADLAGLYNVFIGVNAVLVLLCLIVLIDLRA